MLKVEQNRGMATTELENLPITFTLADGSQVCVYNTASGLEISSDKPLVIHPTNQKTVHVKTK